MTDEELLAAIDAAESQSIGVEQSTIATDRADAIDRYLGKQYSGQLAPAEGRSSVVSRDVSDVVEGVLANILKPFVAGDEIVRFEPLGPDDEERAKQETDYVNFIALQRNNGFLVLNAALKDALLLRAGYVKACWTKRTDVLVESYRGQTEDELALLLSDRSVEVVEHTQYMDPTGIGLHDVLVRRTKPTEYVSIEPCPPDEILVSQRQRSPELADCDFVQHRTKKTLSELRQAGYDVPDDINDGDAGDTAEEYARQRSFGQLDDDTQDPARKLVLFKESWLLIDRDGDGIAERRRVCSVGRNLLADEETDIVPIASFCAVLMPHQHIGISVYDLVKDLAESKTALMRQFLDNKYLSNNARVIANSNVELDDLMISRPGGIVRTKNANPVGNDLAPIVTPDTGPSALQGLEYLDMVREGRTGYTRQTQGLETDALVSKTVGGMQMQLSQAQMRLEMMARTLAETGVREMFRIIHALTLKYGSGPEKVRLRNKWVEIDPRQWVKRTDLSISVGLGNASQQTLLAGLSLIGQAQAQAMPLGLVKPDNVYAVASKLVNAAGFKNPEEFFSPPQVDPQTGQAMMPPPPPNPAVQVEQIRQQGAMQIKQFEMQNEQQKFQAEDVLKQREMAAQMEVQRSNDERQALLDQQKAALEAQSREQEMVLERYKIELEVAAKKEIEFAKIAAQERSQAMQFDHEGRVRADDERRDNEKASRPEVDQINRMFMPRTVLRDARGRVVGVDHGGVVHEVVRDEQGRVAGMRPRGATVQ